MESVNPPMHSISPTLVATAAPFKGLELGVGASCNHCISAKPSKETPDKYDSSTQPAYMQRPTSIIVSVKHTPVADASQPSGFRDSVDIVRDSTSFYTFQGWKLMGRISLDPKVMFMGDEGIFGASDLKIFAEMAATAFARSDPRSGRRPDRR